MIAIKKKCMECKAQRPILRMVKSISIADGYWCKKCVKKNVKAMEKFKLSALV